MKIQNNAIMLFLLLMCVLSPAMAQQKTVTVSGKVVDSLTGAAIPGAAIILSAITGTLTTNPDSLGNLKYDTVYSNATGNFSQALTVSQSANILVYGVLKQDYQIKYSYTFMLLNTVSLGNIKLSKAGDLIKDTITVTGIVVDSATGAGIVGAQLIMSGLGSFDTSGNTALTGSGGSFSKQVIAGNSAAGRELVYMASMDGYQPMVGQQQISGKTLDLGTIRLKQNGQGVIYPIGIVRQPLRANSVSFYSLQGKLLYTGAVGALDTKTCNGKGIVVAVFKNQARIAGTKKVMTLLQ